MIQFTSAQFDLWLAAFFWPFLRIVAMVASAPFFGARGIPASVKIAFSLALTIMVAPMLGPMPNVPVASVPGLMILIDQLLIGTAMGLALRVVFAAVEMAGHIMGLQMGLGFATFFDPQNSTQVPVVGQFLGLIAMLLFLAINGHLVVLTALVDSFRILPVDLTPFASNAWKTLAIWGGEIFSAGVLISMPVVAALMMTNIALAILNRAAPTLNIFTVGFPLTLALGFIGLALTLPHMLPIFSNMVDDSVRMMLKLATEARSTAAF